VDRILDLTSGRSARRAFFRDLVLPAVRPFLSQRYVFGTGIMVVFMSLLANVLGPSLSAEERADLSPAAMAETAGRFTDQLGKKWAQLRAFQSSVVDEARRLKEDLYGRLDYHLISILFDSYSKSVKDQEKKKSEQQRTKPPTKDR
jgi:hypothetical protein